MTTHSVSALPAHHGLLVEIGRFGRFSVLGFSLLLPLAGAAAVSRDVTAMQLLALGAVGVAFHIFAYVSNDVFDLPIDRTEPLRAGSPLVRGLVRPGVALTIALVPVPLACTLHLSLGGAPAAAAALLAAMALMLIYNRYGKRMPFPLLSDAVQAIGWVALAMYGALTVHAQWTAALGWLCAIVFVYVIMVNGLHGGLRDIQNDARHGARTTAIYLGARADEEGRLIVPRRVAVYAFVLQLLLLLFGVLSVRAWPVAAAAIVAAHAVLFVLGRAALRATATRREVVRLGFAHLFLSLGVVLLPFALFGNGVVAAAIVAVYAAPVVVLAVRMSRAIALPLLAALPIAAEPVREVTREELVGAMRAQKRQGYDVTATPNGARFNSGVVLHLARAAHAADPEGPPLFVDHGHYFEAFLAAAGVTRENAPTYVRIARDFREDQLIDYRQRKVISRIRRGRRPLFAVNVVAGWSGGAPRYSYEDHQSKPALRVTHERFSSYRLLDFGDMLLIDDIQGISGRALTGLLGLVFRLIGDADAVRSFSAIAADNTMITLTTGRKGFSVTTAATVWPGGTAEKDVPPRYASIERRLRAERFAAEYVPLEKKSPSQHRHQ